MKILFIQHRVFPALGGSEKHTCLLSKYLSLKGHNVEIFTSTSLKKDDLLSFSLSYPFIKKPKNIAHVQPDEIISGIKIKRYEIKFRFWSFLWIPDMNNDIKKNLDKFDIIHSHGYTLSYSLIACYYAKKKSKPFILTAHDIIISQELPIEAKIFKKLYDITFGKYLLKNSERLIALTDDQIPQYLASGAPIDKIRIVPNGIELEKFLKVTINSSILDQFKIKENDDILLFIGRIEKYKGIQDIIKIMPEILKIYPNLKLFIVGEDYGFKFQLIKYAKKLNILNKIFFTGPISEANLLQLFKRADIFVFPSKMEGFGIVLLEAMASNTLCIAYDIPSVRKVISNGENGILIKSSDELFIKILYYLKNIEERAEIEKKALQFVQEYDMKNIINKIENIYKEVLN